MTLTSSSCTLILATSFFTTYGIQNKMLNKREKDKLEALCKFVILGFINLGHLHHLF